MTKSLSAIFATLLLMAVSSQVFAECESPQAPIIPDGNVASEDELVAAQQAMKAFQGSLAEQRVCLETEENAIDTEVEGSIETVAAITAAYDASVDAEQAVAEEFNAAVRAFKARQ